MAKIAVIPGDGAGKEVMPEALRILEYVNSKRRLGLTFESFDYGADRYLKTGVALPPGQIEDFRERFDAILFGAVGDPRVKDQVHARRILLALRFELDLYINFRPCRLLDDRLSPLVNKGRKHLDFVVFRENTEGQYGAIGGKFKAGTPDEVSISEEINTRKGVERIIRAAFEWAQKNNRSRVIMADKSNAIGAHELWQRTFEEISVEHPRIEAKHFFIDALAMQMVLKPETLQVIVTTNLFGDIITDLGAALTGGLGMAPSANLNPDSTPLFEPVHGSAPDIAGRGIANPAAMILASALMLRELGHEAEAMAIERAVEQAVQAKKCTQDVGGGLTTAQAATAVLEQLKSLLE